MKMQSNTILITGGTSGIGRGLAEAFHKLGNQVIISGRREEHLRNICAAHSGMHYFVLDVTDPHSIRHVAAQIAREFPQLNAVFNNAGVQRGQDFASGRPLDERLLMEEINTNILGLVRVSAEFIPQLAGKPNATLVNVSSGLAFAPLAFCPVYCATKAFVHSLSLSLRHQLKGKGIRVLELVPPYVATELGGAPKTAAAPPPGAPQPMPLEAFIADTMKELAGDSDELLIGPAKGMAAGAGLEGAKKIFANMNH
jgi:uncharacterized oxidoreductase